MAMQVLPVKGVRRFGKRGILDPHYIGFKILEKIGHVVCRLELSDQLARIHKVFHISILRKHVRDEDPAVIPNIRGLDVQRDTSYAVDPVKIVDFQKKHTRNRVIRMVKVQ